MPEVLRLAGQLYTVQRPSELKSLEEVLGGDCSGIDAMVALPSYGEEPYFTPLIAPMVLQEHLVPYLADPYVHFVQEKQSSRSWKVHYNLILDTAYANHISKFIKGKSYQGITRIVKYGIDAILYQELNVDNTFYLVQNIGQAHPIAQAMKNNSINSPYQFWEALKENFKHDLINLQLFQNIDRPHYRQTREVKFTISTEDAVSNSVDATYQFYAADDSQELIRDFLFSQQTILLQLLAMLRVQLSPGTTLRDKMAEFLGLIQDKGVYSDREAIVAYHYFKDPGIMPLMEKIRMGEVNEHWPDQMENLAWKMTAPRLMERMIAVVTGDDFVVPLLLTADRQLSDLITCYPVKAVIIDRRSGETLSIPKLNTVDYLAREDFSEIVTNFFSAEKVAERYAKRVTNLETLSQHINNAYKELNTILSSHT